VCWLAPVDLPPHLCAAASRGACPGRARKQLLPAPSPPPVAAAPWLSTPPQQPWPAVQSPARLERTRQNLAGRAATTIRGRQRWDDGIGLQFHSSWAGRRLAPSTPHTLAADRQLGPCECEVSCMSCSSMQTHLVTEGPPKQQWVPPVALLAMQQQRTMQLVSLLLCCCAGG
jgi:hypothetical protein